MVSDTRNATWQRTKRGLLVLGIVMLVGSALLFMAMLGGLAQLPDKLFAGESTVHSVARVAIVGCLLAAIGTLE